MTSHKLSAYLVAFCAVLLSSQRISAQYYYFGTDQFVVYEGGTVSGTVYRSSGSSVYDLCVLVNTNVGGVTPLQTSDLNGLVTSGACYQPSYNIALAHFNSGASSATFSFGINENSTVQTERGATLVVGGYVNPGSGTVLWGPVAPSTNYVQQAWLLVQDNDSPVTVSRYAAAMPEGSVNYFFFDRSTNSIRAPMTVRFTLSGSATLNTDYQISAPAPFTLVTGTTNQLTIPVGYGYGQVDVTLTRDSLVEGDETITARIEPNSAQYTMPGTPTATMTNLDDTPAVSVSLINQNVTEGGNPIGFKVSRSYYYPGGNSIAVNLSIGGTATAGIDYTPSLSTSVTIPSGQFSVTNWITPLTDTNVEGVETVSVTVLPGNYYVVDAASSNAIAYIADDYPVLNVQATDNYAAELTTNVGTFTITRIGNTSKAVTAQLSITGTATPGVDYVALPTSVTLGAGVLTTNLTVTPLANAGVEPAETVVLGLQTNASYVLGLYTNAVVTITGDGPNPRDAYPKGERYMRGSGTNLDAYSMVVPLDGLKGTRRGDVEFFGTYTTMYHYNATNAGNQAYLTNRIPFNTPIASFGSQWGSPLFLGQSYSLGMYAGVLTADPLLDQLVADLNSDPLALANYVQNEIELTDAIAYRDDGSVATESVNEGGVNRSAVGVYLEGQGSPVEQCALLVYLLRQAGYPATYVFPPEGGLKLLDTRLSTLLRTHINGGQDDLGRLYTTNQLIAVNYPWVAAYVSNQWVHLFPWIKDTAVEEGLDLWDYLPDPYKETQLWVRDYLLGQTNLMAFATLNDDTPGTIFPRWLNHALQQNAPGISLDDIGMRYRNRRQLYAQWSAFPRPTWVTNTSTAIESLASSGITNVSPTLTNIFDTVQVDLYSVANPQKNLATAALRMADLHNRKFFLTHTNLGGGQIQAVLTLGPFRPNATGQGNFSASDTALTNQQVLTLTLDDTDDNLKLRLRHRRQRALAWETALDPDRGFLDLSSTREVLVERPLRKGDIAAICFDSGRVTPAMLRVHAQELWNMEQMLSTNSVATNQVSGAVYQGSLVYLMGMSYYERAARFDAELRRLFKMQDLSSFAMGLAKISPRRNPDGTLYGGTVDPVWPNVDMFFQEVATAGNGTVRLDSGWDHKAATRNYFHLSIADLSAQEHATLNVFYGQSNAVSTVKLLQLAQSKAATGGSNVVQLHYHNYQSAGNVLYNGKALKDHDPGMWAQVVNIFEQSGSQGYVVAWLPPGTQTNASGSFAGMGAFVLGVDRYAALIGNNQYGAFGDRFADNTIGLSTLSTWNTGLLPNGDVRQTFSDPTPTAWQSAYEITPTFNLSSDYSLLNSGALQVNPYQNTLGTVNSLLLNNAVGSYGSTFAPVVDLGTPFNPDFREGNGFWNTLADPVNTLSGEFYVDDVDLSLPGPMPLQVRRNYGSHNLAANQLGYGWKLNYMTYLTVAPSNNVIYAAEPSGSVLAFGLVSSNLWAPTAALNPSLNNDTANGIGSVANYFNARLAKAAVGATNYYYLTNGDGSLRVFQEMSFPLTNSAGWDRLRPYLTTWYDNRSNFYRFEYGPNATAADYGQVRRIVSSSGNLVRFLYDVDARIVEAYSLDGRRVQYDFDDHGDLVTVTRPDGSQLGYEYQLATWSTNSITNVYSTHLLTQEFKPDGRVLKNEYDDQRRVTNQWATVGPDLRLVRNATFRYTNNFALTNITGTLTGTTTVLDYTNNPTTYFYTNGLIRRIRDPFNAELVQDWYEANETNAPAYPRSLKTVTDKRGLVTSYFYDSRGNVTNTAVKGDLLGDGNPNTTAVSLAAYDANNLPTKTVDASGTTNLFFYTNTWLLARVEVWPSNAAPAQAITNLYSYTTVTNSGDGTVSYGLRVQEIRAAGSPDAATNEWAYSSRGFPTRQTRYTATGDSAIVVTNLYNYRGELAQQTDAAGRSTTYGFDPIGRPQSREVFDTGQTIPMAWDYFYYNENGELVWSDGPRYNPEDYIWRDYDGAGRPTQEIRWRSRGKSDGTGVEAVPGDDLYATTFQEYDAFNNLTKVIDPLGNYRLKRYDALGQLTREEFYDANSALLATNGFRYNAAGDVTNVFNPLGGLTEKQFTSAGKPKFQRNPDGSTNAWLYYADGRVRREIQNNGAYWQTTYEDTVRRATKIFYSAAGTPLATNLSELDRRGNLVKHTDAGGNVFTNLFDGLDRLKISAGPPVVTVTGGGPGPFSGLVTNVAQQVTTYTSDNSGKVLIVANALGDKTITTNDALGRPISVEIRDINNVLVHATTTAYAANHHSVTVTNGSGGSAVVSTAFTDNAGRTALSLAYPSATAQEFTWREYDRAGNLVYAERDSSTNGVVTAWSGAAFVYDGLNRATAKSDRDGALTTYAFDAAGNVTNRTMPGGLQWNATYNSAGQRLKDWNSGNGGAGTRTNTYSYFASGNPFAGLLQTQTDGLGLTSTYLYDAWLRPATNSHSSTGWQNKNTSWTYDARGLLTGMAQWNDNNYPITLTRTYDAYGQMSSEAVSVPGLLSSGAGQTWDAAGRRTGLNFGGFSYNYNWRADGLLAAVTTPNGGASYGYNAAGVLTNRNVGNRATTVASLDGAGRPLSITTKVNLSTKLTETLAWTGDGLLNTHTLAREDFTDARSYSYTDLTRRLADERLNLDATKRWTNTFTYDGGAAAGPGTLTKVGPVSGTAQWSGGADAFARINSETNTVSRRPAYGRVNGTAATTVLLDGNASPVMMVSTADPLWPNQWRTTMELTPGAHQLSVTAAHPSGQFTTNRSVWFTNAAANEQVIESYDARGKLTQRIWRSPSGTTNHTQNLEWDALGRLWALTDLDANQNGYYLNPYYDPLNRRVFTYLVPMTAGVPVEVHYGAHYFDPLVEFLELGQSQDYGTTTWKLMGPDLNGVYGGMNGTGGFEAVAPGLSAFNPTISDARGNILGSVTNGAVVWNTARPTGYGAVPGHRPLPLWQGADVVQASAWRGRWADISGYVWLGARYYNPESGSFLDADPAWNERDPNYHTFAGGDPINYFDPDGRWGKQQVDYSHQLADTGNIGNQFLGMAYGLVGAVAQIPEGIGRTFDGAGAGMAQARQEIYGYEGGQAFLGRMAMLPADVAFGTTGLINDPINTISGIPQGFVNFGGKIGTDIYNVGANPSVNTAFNIAEDALAVLGIASGTTRGLTASGVTAPVENFAARSYLQAAKGAQWESYYNSFSPGSARLNVGFGGQTLFRAADSEGAASFGEFASVERPSSPADAIRGNALAPAVTGNRASQLFQVTTRPGFSLQGIAGPQGSGYPGGFTQTFQGSRNGIPTWSSVAPVSY